ncbi:hypothetical protein FQR65_LT01929 [Abscondita terminalis]|nr:hypothetical protein FQR65_LT01929 [Abscondita terminalis]
MPVNPEPETIRDIDAVMKRQVTEERQPMDDVKSPVNYLAEIDDEHEKNDEDAALHDFVCDVETTTENNNFQTTEFCPQSATVTKLHEGMFIESSLTKGSFKELYHLKTDKSHLHQTSVRRAFQVEHTAPTSLRYIVDRTHQISHDLRIQNSSVFIFSFATAAIGVIALLCVLWCFHPHLSV